MKATEQMKQQKMREKFWGNLSVHLSDARVFARDGQFTYDQAKNLFSEMDELTWAVKAAIKKMHKEMSGGQSI